MSNMQEIYDLLVQDIKLLVQYDDKYMKIDNTNILKPNILNDLEHKMKELKQKQSNILLQIKTNNDKKELLEIDINNISYPWFKKVFFPKITKFFDIELKLIFAFYASFTKPFDIHTDIKPQT